MNKHIILPENKSLALFSQPNFTILHNNNFMKKKNF